MFPEARLFGEYPIDSWSAHQLGLLELQRARPDNLLFVQPPAHYASFTPRRGAFFLAAHGARLVGFHLVGYAPAINPLWHDHIHRPRREPVGMQREHPDGCGLSRGWPR
ncbi:hypothetical protein [Polyangium sp. 6x1]|uniref:hypothetical protein n=1 Tax=Polyangium sp. 6x1 TaxID=3042689 RepID=UPI00248282BA|nr:hypothetical protein [Polyangium sp. 6x1]MDI1452185.1 hypothetical protein [Polyangium sp. 6x1]